MDKDGPLTGKDVACLTGWLIGVIAMLVCIGFWIVAIARYQAIDDKLSNEGWAAYTQTNLWFGRMVIAYCGLMFCSILRRLGKGNSRRSATA